MRVTTRAPRVQRSVLIDPWPKARARQSKQCAPPLPGIASTAAIVHRVLLHERLHRHPLRRS
eukprot:8184365-Lingulodinium_polyedra.AAC.1